VPARFQDRIGWRVPGFRDVLRIQLTGGFGNRHAHRDAHRVPRVPHPPDLAPPKTGTAVTWVGHSTCLVQTGGLSFLTDPIWSKRLPGLIPRLTEPGIPFADLPHIDGVVVSHDHYDHLDAGTVKRLPKETPIYAPLGVDTWFRRRGFHDVTGMDWWTTIRRDGTEVTCVPVQHWCQRGILDRNRRLWSGWVLAARDAPRVFFGGDTGYFPGFLEIGERLAPEIAILPVGAYDPPWFMSDLHI
jgi:L-ascorbate metabolism protein UlaG (beta-lactamase superfamily)